MAGRPRRRGWKQVTHRGHGHLDVVAECFLRIERLGGQFGKTFADRPACAGAIHRGAVKRVSRSSIFAAFPRLAWRGLLAFGVLSFEVVGGQQQVVVAFAAKAFSACWRLSRLDWVSRVLLAGACRERRGGLSRSPKFGDSLLGRPGSAVQFAASTHHRGVLSEAETVGTRSSARRFCSPASSAAVVSRCFAGPSARREVSSSGGDGLSMAAGVRSRPFAWYRPACV